MPALSDPQPEVQRHRAAIRRSDFSLPLKCVLRDPPPARLLWKPGGRTARRPPASRACASPTRLLCAGSPDPAPATTDRSPESPRSQTPATGNALSCRDSAGRIRGGAATTRGLRGRAPQPDQNPGDLRSRLPARSGDLRRRDPSMLPVRSRRYGVGKEIGGAVYVHRQYEDRLGPTVIWAKRLVPADYAYDVVKVNRRTNAVSFIQCPQFDVEPEPISPAWSPCERTARCSGERYPAIRRFIITSGCSWTRLPGFDVEQSKLRSAAWLALPDVDKSRIGRRSYWQTHVVPRLDAVSAHRIRLQ